MAHRNTRKRLERMFQDEKPLGESDPGFVEMFNRFAYGDVAHRGALHDGQRSLVVLSSLLGCDALDEFEVMAQVALNVGVEPRAVKETIYQSLAFLGMGRVFPFLRVANDLFESKGVALPLDEAPVPELSTTHHSGVEIRERLKLQVGDDAASEPGRPSPMAVLEGLATDYAFGDYFTRPGLDLPTREMAAFCLLTAMGDCDEDLRRHLAANIAVGNDRDVLADAVLQCLPYIGFPRVRKALRLLEER
ncbi:MAG: carboxymuconolactone decarboxylase family protein [Bifidobacterium psychraerophilum]|uniref:carboxymuconolactone decarboxylase family protein n=1 Tax=Bifidobacterium psychraerophilum TaxID=218140 RepID=UPI0039E937B5